MNELIRKDILDILHKVAQCLESKKGSDCLRELSTHTVHNASIFQDEDALSIAIAVYTLSKLAETNFRNLDLTHFTDHLAQSRTKLEQGDDLAYRESITGIFTHLRNATPQLTSYIEDVMRDGKIKRAKHIHDHGISVTQTAHLLGINTWELNQYLGKTKFSDTLGKAGIPLEKRLTTAREIFK